MPPVGSADYPAETEGNDAPAIADPLASGTKGFTASIYPMGDIDIFEVDVMTPGSDLSVAIHDLMGGCPFGSSFALRAQGPGGFLGADNGSCPQLDTANNPGMANLPAGKHYVQVENWTFGIEPAYRVDISLQLPTCGNGITQGVEQCDDGNMVSGDGCTPDCKLEGNFVNEMEPNQPLPSANSVNGVDGIFASIQPVGDQDFFSFDITVPGSSVALEVGDGFMGCPTGFDSVLYLYSPTGTLIVSDDESGVDSCSLISPATHAEAANLPAGKYTAKVEEYLNDNSQGSYVLKIKISAPGCGDGLLQIGEECDDNNTTAGDGCSATCMLEGMYLLEMEPNNVANAANTINGYDGARGAIQPIGDQDYFSFDVTVPNSSVRIETTNGYGGCPTGFDSLISLYTSNNQLVVSDDEDGADACSLISPQLDVEATNLAVGKYRIKVEEYNNDATQASYVLKVKVMPPGCGDSLLTPGEQCDDGNTMSGDGCSATCMSEPPWEIENNNMLANATPLWPATTMFYGAVLPIGDVDYFSFTLPAGKKPLLEVHNIGSNANCDFDSLITLYDSAGTMIASDDDLGTNSCSRINAVDYPAVANLPAGTYYVVVGDYGDNDAIASYQLDVIFQ